MQSRCVLSLFLCMLGKSFTLDKEYAYFPTNQRKTVWGLTNNYSLARIRLLSYKAIYEITFPEDLARGRFHGLLQMLDVEPKRMYKVRRAIANVIHYLQRGAFIVITKNNVHFTNFRLVLAWWRYFYLCLTSFNFHEHYGPCTSGFVIQNPKDKNITQNWTSLLDWDPKRDLELLPSGKDFLLILFNLGLCQNFHNRLHFVCPSACLGRIKPGVVDIIPTEDGNPCALDRHTRTPSCMPRRIWSVYLYQFFKELVDPVNWEKLPGKDFMKWAIEESGYTCDCAERYRWVDSTMRCERSADWTDGCDTNSTNLFGPCNETGTYQCMTDQDTGGTHCQCNAGFYGTYCNYMLDACIMKLVSYIYTNPRTGILERKMSTGNEMCNINMSGLALPRKKPNESGITRSRCVPTLGSTDYLCECKEPFMEDSTHSKSNCFRRAGSCEDRLCIHGACVSSTGPNEKSVCICYPNYDGPMCEYKSEHWSVWSECLPICGRNRTRTRKRSTSLRDPSSWEPYFEELAGIPPSMSDMELRTYPGELIQAEVCPPRTGAQCPFSPSNPTYLLPKTKDPGLLELQSAFSLAIAVLLFLIGMASFAALIVRGPQVAQNLI